MVKPLLAALFTLFVALAAYLYHHLGFSAEPQIIGLQNTSFNFLYVDNVGPYHKINDKIVEVEQWAAKHSLECKLTFGEFLDDPQSMDEERLRSRVGCISVNEAGIESLSGEFATQDFPIKIENRDPADHLVIEFYGSPAIGPFKVYPAYDEWLAQNNKQSAGPPIEVYRVLENDQLQTTYYFPVK